MKLLAFRVQIEDTDIKFYIWFKYVTRFDIHYICFTDVDCLCGLQ